MEEYLLYMRYSAEIQNSFVHGWAAGQIREYAQRSSVDERVDGDASDKPPDIAVLTRMKQFRAMNKLKKVALKVIAENLSGLKEMFKSMDTDTSGTIIYEELKAGIPKLGTRLSESEIRRLM